MSDYLAAGLFIGFMGLLYLLLLSRFGLLARRARAWEKSRERLHSDESQNGRLQNGDPTLPPGSTHLDHERSDISRVPWSL